MTRLNSLPYLHRENKINGEHFLETGFCSKMHLNTRLSCNFQQYLKQLLCRSFDFIPRKSNVIWNISRFKSTRNHGVLWSAQSVDSKMVIWNKKQDLTQALRTMNEALARGILPASKSFDILLYLCNMQGKHEELDKWYTERQERYNGVGWGTTMTLIRSFCCRGRWKDALELLKKQMKERKLYHTRFYNPIIQAAADAGHTDEAFRLFEEKIKHSQSVFNKESLLVPDTEMLAALLRCCSRKSSKSHNHTSKRAEDVFRYYQNTGAILPEQVVKAAHDWFKSDQANTWRWKGSTVNSEGLCSECGKHLVKGKYNMFADFHHLREEILRQFSTGLDSHILNTQDKAEFQKFKNSVKENGPFDIIIDGMSIGLTGTDPKKPIFINSKELKNLVLQLNQKGKKVCVVLQKAALPDIDNSAEYISELQELCLVDITSNHLDDLHILYAAAYCGMRDVQVITKDTFKDHHVLFDLHSKWIYLKWTRLNCLSFKINKGEVYLSENCFDPVVQRTDKTWHFPVEHDQWICVVKQ